eukprot:762977-Hanusia_phi.AAC.2
MSTRRGGMLGELCLLEGEAELTQGEGGVRCSRAPLSLLRTQEGEETFTVARFCWSMNQRRGGRRRSSSACNLACSLVLLPDADVTLCSSIPPCLRAAGDLATKTRSGCSGERKEAGF